MQKGTPWFPPLPPEVTITCISHLPWWNIGFKSTFFLFFPPTSFTAASGSNITSSFKVLWHECIFGCEKPGGVGILEWGVDEQGEGNGESSLQATWERGGRILSQQGGFQVSKGEANGEQKGMSKNKGIIVQCKYSSDSYT